MGWRRVEEGNRSWGITDEHKWAAPKRGPDEVEGQRRLDGTIAIQREGDRGADGKTRRALPPVGDEPLLR